MTSSRKSTRGDPEADDLAAEAVRYVDWVDAVAEGLGEGAALLVERPAGGGDHAVGCLVLEADRGEQGGVEPASMLVATLGVEVGGEAEFGLEFEDGVPACAGLEPDIEDVHLFAEVGAAAVGAGGAGGQQGSGAVLVPGVGAFAMEEIDEAFVDLRVVQGLVAGVAEEDGDGDAPDALAADAPVGACGDHVGDALFAPGWIPGDALDLVERALAEGGFAGLLAAGEDGGLHADEPLLGGAEDERLVTAPAVRVAVHEVVRADEGAASAEEVFDGAVGLVDEEALVLGEAVAELALGVDVAGEGQTVALAGGEVVGAVGGGGVDGAGALVGGDVVGEDAEDFAVEEGVLEGGAVQLVALEGGDGLRESERGHLVGGFQDLRRELDGDDVDAVVGDVLKRDVVDLGVEGDGERGGDGPRRGGPDDGEDVAAGEARVEQRGVGLVSL